ncbi:MAG: hypothetical protein ACLPQS_18005 [Acidimicrobiales bacterium]
MGVLGLAAAISLPVLAITSLAGTTTARHAPSSGATRSVVSQLGELKGTDTVAGDLLASAAISGTTIVAGAPDHANDAGRAYVFAKTASGWRQATELKGTDTVADDDFGAAVAISGTTIVVGAPGHAEDAGRVYVFAKTASGREQVAELTGSDTADYDGFGYAVAISGTTMVVGAPGRTFGEGRAYVFTEQAGGWRQLAELSGSDTAPADQFGAAVAISGTTLVVGAYGHAHDAGSAYVFEHQPSGWTQVAELKGSDTVDGDYFGYSVALSTTTVLAGAPGHADDAGTAYVFEKGSTGWTQAAELKSSEGAFDNYFAAAVALSGATAVVGDPGQVGNAGRVDVFSQQTSRWAQTAELKGDDTGADDFLGDSVALSDTTVVAGAPNHSDIAGRVYVFGEATGLATPATSAPARARAQSSQWASAGVPGSGNTTGGPIRLAHAPSKAHPLRIILFGDSVMRGDAPAITAALESTGVVQVDDAGFDGWGLTTDKDWRQNVPPAIEGDHAALVIAMWSFDGSFLMRHPTEYRQWLSEFVRLVVAQRGVAGLMFQEFPALGPPPVTNPVVAARDGAASNIPVDAWDNLARSLVTLVPKRVMYLPLGPAVERAGRFQFLLPPGDDWSLPMQEWVRVRMDDSVHFCPAGAARYAAALMSDLTALYHLPKPAPGWSTGSWTKGSDYESC